jgi:hypothetical protein
MTTTQNIPAKGDRHLFPVHSGYIPLQSRPRDCQRTYTCVCGTCDGTSSEVEAEVTEVIYWMDNSIEVVGLADDGRYYRQTMVAPHGDRCY